MNSIYFIIFRQIFGTNIKNDKNYNNISIGTYYLYLLRG